MEIKDSGDRTEFDTGAVRDMHEGKGRMDLLPLDIISNILNYQDMKAEGTALDQFIRFIDTKDPRFLYSAFRRFAKRAGWDIPTALIELSIHFEEGAKKYGPGNWTKGIDANSYVDSSIRHYVKFLRGDDDEPHNRAVLWNWVCLLWTIQNRPHCCTHMNDIPMGTTLFKEMTDDQKSIYAGADIPSGKWTTEQIRKILEVEHE